MRQIGSAGPHQARKGTLLERHLAEVAAAGVGADNLHAVRHIVCISCQRVMEFDDCNLETMTAELERRLNVRIHGHLLEFYAICSACEPLTESS